MSDINSGSELPSSGYSKGTGPSNYFADDAEINGVSGSDELSEPQKAFVDGNKRDEKLISKELKKTSKQADLVDLSAERKKNKNTQPKKIEEDNDALPFSVDEPADHEAKDLPGDDPEIDFGDVGRFKSSQIKDLIKNYFETQKSFDEELSKVAKLQEDYKTAISQVKSDESIDDFFARKNIDKYQYSYKALQELAGDLNKTPEQREIDELRKYREESEAKKRKDEEKNLLTQEQQKQKAKFEQAAEYVGRLHKMGGFPDTADVRGRIADVMLGLIEKNQVVSPHKIVASVWGSMVKEYRHISSQLSDDQLENFLGSDGMRRIESIFRKKLRANREAAEPKNHNAYEFEETERKQPISLSEYEQIRKKKAI